MMSKKECSNRQVNMAEKINIQELKYINMPESRMQWGDQFSDYNHVYYEAPCVQNTWK